MAVTASPQSGPFGPKEPEARRLAKRLVGVFLLLVALVGLASYLYLRQLQAEAKTDAHRLLTAIADLKRRMAVLEKECRRLGGLLAKVPQPQAEPVAGQKARITGKGMRSLRRKLGLTREQFAKLVGITASGVYLWEKKNGPLRLREATRAAILAVRLLGTREAKQRLAGMAKVKAVKVKKGGKWK